MGPISGMPNFNDENFARVKAELEAIGNEVWSPHERTPEQIAEAASLDVAGDIGSAQVHHFWMRISLEKIVSGWPHMVCLLDGWDKSKGAQLELAVAVQIGVGAATEHGNLVEQYTYNLDWRKE